MGQVNQVTLRLTMEGAEATKAALQALGPAGDDALKRLNFDTATGSAKGFNAIMQEGTGVAREYAAGLGPIGGVLSTLGGGWLAAGAAGGVFLEILEKSIEKAEAYDQSVRGLEATLRATGDASGVTAEDVEGMADRIAGSTLNTREAVISAAEELASFGNIAPDAFEKTLEAAADLAASPAFKGDMVAAVKAIGAAMEGNFTQLKRAIPEVSQVQLDLIKNMEDTGDQAGALQKILDDLAGSVGGDAAAQHAGLSGATHDLDDAWTKLNTDFGNTKVPTELINGLTDAVRGLDNAVNNRDWSDFAKLFIPFAGPGIVFSDLMKSGAAGDAATPKKTYADHYASALTDSIYADPNDVKAAFGPDIAAMSKFNDSLASLDKFNVALDHTTDELQKAPLQQAIDEQVAKAAKAAGIDANTYSADPRYASQYQATVSGATSAYDAKNASKWSNEAEAAQRKADAERDRQLKQLDDANNIIDKIASDADKQDAQSKAFYDELTAKAHASYADMIASQDAFQVASLQGQSGYFDALQKQLDDSTAAQQQAVQDELQKELDAIAIKRAAHVNDLVQQKQLDADQAAAEQAAADRSIAVAQNTATKQLEITRQEEGDLAKWIDLSTADGTQTLKTLASDGLGSIDNALKAVASGTEKVGDAAKSVLLDITGDAFQKAVEGNVLGPLGKWLNGEIGDGAKADGSEDNPFYVKLAGLGGIPGVGGGDGLLSDFFDSLFGSKGVPWDNTPLSTVFNPADLVTPQLPHFAGGGEFDVPGAGGTDSRLVAFKATPGETVSIRTPSQRNYVDPMAGASKASAPPDMRTTNHFHLSGTVSEREVKSWIAQSLSTAVSTARSKFAEWWQDVQWRGQ